ncbi:hypothetical protein CHS0354_007782 [Potamilus streckersoni]|uniref:BEACH domain-containing protein n=1 Tax=Potamilus streckersoni TaxID=2493646 RepID=A0AAE0RS31_9BIVA|nr:hypothetical protein CHS0354_007782 [Potamilus streckersoni]
MSYENVLTQTLLIPRHHQRWVSKDRAVCLVTEEYLLNWKQGSVKSYGRSRSLSSAEAELMLAPSYEVLTKPWIRISVKIIQKSDHLVDRLRDEPLSSSQIPSCLAEHLAQVCRENFCNLWTSAAHKFSSEPNSVFQNGQDQFTEVVKKYLLRLQPGFYINLTDKQDSSLHTGSLISSPKNTVPLLGVVDCKDVYLVVQPYLAYSLQNIAMYSPMLFSRSNAKPLFILYQVLQCMASLHERGLALGRLSLYNILVDKKLWVYVMVPSFSFFHCNGNQICQETAIFKIRGSQENENLIEVFETSQKKIGHIEKETFASEHRNKFKHLSENEQSLADAVEFFHGAEFMNYSLDDLSQITESWVTRKLSNFKYLMILNYLTGRRTGDPNHHPVLPWVTDFSTADGVIRNLKRSKFRLNKGDSQLDFTYETMTNISNNIDHIPHHVSDVLSDITYYVYKARRTPKQILCKYVRSKWVPNEYPVSMQRMYQWTPDECIPEFFTDPTIFTSIHEDLPDLQLPSWCTSAQDFVLRHMNVLESEDVSEKLHYWIDLTFGFKLSGQASVKSKNVYLQLVDQHKNVKNYGVVQLFSHPHPHRLPISSQHDAQPPRFLGTQDLINAESSLDGKEVRPETAKIFIPRSFDPLAPLDQFESLHAFTSRAMRILSTGLTPRDFETPYLADPLGRQQAVWRDMQNFGCVMCEMFSSQKLPLLQPNTSLKERYRMIQRLHVQDRQILPRFLQKAAEILLHLDSQLSAKTSAGRSDGPLFDYPLINSMGLPPPTPTLLLQPYVDVLPFPSYFANLYNCLQQFKDKDNEIEKVKMDMTKSKGERRKLIKVTARQKVALLEKYLVKYRGDLSEEGYEILLPYIEDLFQDPNTTVQAAWSLINLIGQDLGPKETSKRFLSYLSLIFIGEESTPNHMKLYHRTFLVQLLLRLGLDTFLTNFSTLLVEATAGYKDFVSCNNTGNLEEEEEDETAEGKEEEDVFVEDCHKEVSSIENPLEGQTTIEDELLEDSRPDIEDADEPQVEDDIPDEEFGAMWIDGDVMMENVKDNSSRDSKDELSFDSHSSDQASMKSGETDGRKDLCQDDSMDRVSIHSISAFLHQSHQPLTAKEETKNSFNEFSPDIDEDADVTVSDSDIAVDDVDSADDVDEISDVTSENHTRGQISSYSMIRSETDEFNQIHHTQTCNIRDIAAESIKWLSHRLGPLLTAKFLSKNLVRMLALCYLGEEQMERVNQTGKGFPHTSYAVVGDNHAVKVLECLNYVACLYGEQVILLQYLPCIVDLVHVSWKRLTVRAEAGLVAALVLMRHMIPLLSDTAFMDVLQESVIKEVIFPSLKLLSSTSTTFPSGSLYRSVALFKMVDIIYIIGLRLGFEMTRHHMTPVLKSFFKPFSDVYGIQSKTPTSNSPGELKEVPSQKSLKSMDSVDESYLNIKKDESTQDYIIGSPVTISFLAPDAVHSPKLRGKPLKASYSLSMGHMIEERDEDPDVNKSTGENIQLEMRETFSAKLAYAAYIPLTSVFGSHHMEDNVSNDDLIRRLCSQCDSSLNISGCFNNASNSDQISTGSDNVNHVEMVGNQIRLPEEEDLGISPETRHLRNQFSQSGILRVEHEETKCSDIDRNKHRHLRGDWLAYWEHELGLNERDTVFNFKQIKLQTFLGHTNSIRSITVLDSENSFISASKDKTVKLWSLCSFGDGSGKCKYQASYEQHKKSVFSVVYLENIRLVASCDSTVHIWDPFTEHTIRQLDSSKYSPVIALTPLPLPSTVIVTATTDCTLRFLDLRTANYAHEFRCTLTSAGPIRCVTVSPDGSWVAVGFSTGVISILDLQTGILMSTWKGHDGEIVQMKTYNKNTFVSTSFDMTMKLWNVEDGKEICQFKGYSEPIHCVNFYKGQIISATTGNKIGVHTSVDKQANFSSTKLRSETFKGVLTSMAILPLNRTMLLGADNGSIRLLC